MKKLKKGMFLILSAVFILLLLLSNIDYSPNIIYSENVILEDSTPCLRSKNLLIQYVRNDTLWANRDLTIYRSTDGGTSFKKQFTFSPPFLSKLYIKSNPVIRKIFGFSVNLKILAVNPILLDINWRVYRSDNGGESFAEVNRGISPLAQGIAMDTKGNIYYGEYPSDYKGGKRVFFSSDSGLHWETLYTFYNIRHIHSVRYDKYSNKIWVTTGDWGNECLIGYLEIVEGTVLFVPILTGSQRYRAVSLLFDENYVYWGMDSPTIQNYILRYNRKTGAVEELAAINGPAYYSMTLNNGTMVIATAVESKKGEWDDKISIWSSRNGTNWKRTISMTKEPSKKKVLAILPNGEGSSSLVMTTTDTREFSSDLLVVKLH